MQSMSSMQPMNIAFAICLIAAGTLLLSSETGAAQSDSADQLVQDIRAFESQCPAPPRTQLCTNEYNALKARQAALHLSDDDLEKQGITYKDGKR